MESRSPQPCLLLLCCLLPSRFTLLLSSHTSPGGPRHLLEQAPPHSGLAPRSRLQSGPWPVALKSPVLPGPRLLEKSTAGAVCRLLEDSVCLLSRGAAQTFHSAPPGPARSFSLCPSWHRSWVLPPGSRHLVRGGSRAVLGSKGPETPLQHGPPACTERGAVSRVSGLQLSSGASRSPASGSRLSLCDWTLRPWPQSAQRFTVPLHDLAGRPPAWPVCSGY